MERSANWSVAIVTALVFSYPASSALSADLKMVTKAPPPAPPSWWSTLTIDGYVEGGITGTSPKPADGINFGSLFTDKADRPLLNQALVTIQRPLDPKATGYDFGFKLQTLYGSDARSTQFLGEFAHSINSIDQFNIVEAYGIAHLPWLTSGGIDVKAGQYVTLEGAETIYALTNPFYSHSYIFNFGIPFKHTGAMTITHVNSTIDIYAGIDTGVNTTFGNEIFPNGLPSANNGDDNKAAAFHGGIALNNLFDGALTIMATTHIGPENPDTPAIAAACNCNPNGALRYLNDVMATWTVNKQLTLTTDLNYIRDDGFHATGGGAAQYAVYTINDWLKFGVRGEIWRDNNSFFVAAFPGNFDFVNAELGLPNGSFTGGSTTYAEVTTGFTITPSVPTNPLGIKQVIMRPEIRYDTSLNGTTPFGGGTKSSQFTFAGDLIIPFTIK
jgi:hypothetical protein